MLRKISSSELTTLENNHSDNKALPIVTDRLFIELDQLEEFISANRTAHNKRFKALKISFIRYPLQAGANDARIRQAGNNLSQVSLLISPVFWDGNPTWATTTLTEADQQISTLCICVPGTSVIKDKSGLCPPTCGRGSDSGVSGNI